MTRPEFDELIGADVTGGERERLRRVHDLLVAAGPPPELAPHLEAGPTLAMTLGRRERPRRHRLALLAAALVVLALAFLGGYLAGNNNGTPSASGRTMQLAGTKAAPDALASLRVLPADGSGNWPMTLRAVGLPKLPAGGYYEVYLVRNGKVYAPCGTFVASGGDAAVEVTLNAPYRLRHGDTWVVTRQAKGDHEAGPVVLRPTV
jgi:hypothetical protein